MTNSNSSSSLGRSVHAVDGGGDSLQPVEGFVEFADIKLVGLHEDHLAGIEVGKQRDGVVGSLLEVAETNDIAVGFDLVEDAIGTGKGLDEAVVFEVFVHVERVHLFGVEARQEHIDDEQNVHAVGVLKGVFFALLDALGDVLVISCKNSGCLWWRSLVPYIAL